MGREIKFRAWDKKLSLMTAVFDFFGLDDMRLYFNTLERFIEQDRFSDLVIMQFTGLKDKNGKEIYEGDIVKYKFTLLGGVDEVIFRDGKFELKNDYVNEVGYRTVKNVSEYCEIIGNIYEHSHLLK